MLWLAGHCALTLLYVSPANPMRASMLQVLNETIGAAFPQNWSFFAPDPIAANEALIVRPLTAEESAAVSIKGLPKEGWYDLSTPLWKRFQSNRFSAYDRLARPQSNAIRLYLAGGQELMPWLEACAKGDTSACRYYERHLIDSRARAASVLSKVASAFCNGQPGMSGATQIALRVRESMSIPWSKRYDRGAKQSAQDIELGIYPIDKSIVSPGVYLATYRNGGQ